MDQTARIALTDAAYELSDQLEKLVDSDTLPSLVTDAVNMLRTLAQQVDTDTFRKPTTQANA